MVKVLDVCNDNKIDLLRIIHQKLQDNNLLTIITL